MEEPTSVVFDVPKENGGSEAAETVEGDILRHQPAEDGPEILASDLHKPALLFPEDEVTEELIENEEMPDLDDFAHPLTNDEIVVEETIVLTSLNGGQESNEPLAQDLLCTVDAIVSNETEDVTPDLEFLGDIDIVIDDVKVSETAEDMDKVEEAVEVEQSIKTADSTEEVQPKENEQTENKELAETDADKGSKVPGKKSRERNRSTSEESTGGKDAAKGKFVIQADLNINSRPKRSTPRRSVFELLQGEIKSTGTSKRSSTDTGSESDPEPGPSKRSITKKSRLTGSEQLESIDEVDRNKGEKSQGNRNKGKGNQVKGKSQGKDEKRPNKEIRKKSADTVTLSADHGDVYVPDDFDVVETVVGADGRNPSEAEAAENEDDLELALEEFRAVNPNQCFDDDPSDGHNVPCEDPTVEIGVDAECELEYNSRWHSYATPRQLESPPPPVRKAGSVEPPDLKNDVHQPESEEHNELADDEKTAADEPTSKKRTKYDRVEAPELEAIVDKDKGQSSTPWYMTTTSDDGFLNDTKALQSRIDELIAVNTELKARLKEVENKTATKKFNIDFHSRKFSRAREPVFGSPADRSKLVVERKSVGKAAFGSPAEKGSVGVSVEKDLKEKELMLVCREEKLRALDVELDERTSQLKVNEGKMWRTERRLKEMEKTLDYRERVLKRMEPTTEKKDPDTTEATEASNAAGDTEPTGPDDDAPGKDVDVVVLKRKEQELERQRMFLTEEREKLLPKQHRLTKWEAELRRKEDELRSREQELSTAGRSKKHRVISRSDDESDSDDDGIRRMKKPVGKSHAALVHKRPPVSLGKSKKVPPAKVFKTPSKLSSSSKSNEAMMKHVKRMKEAAASRMSSAAQSSAASSSAVAGKKRPADSAAAPVKEYKLRKRC